MILNVKPKNILANIISSLKREQAWARLNQINKQFCEIQTQTQIIINV